MVVLESHHHNSHTHSTSGAATATPTLQGGGGHNQYLQPDYLTPLPVTLDSKKSPLAMLVQTCSQIGADTNNPTPTTLSGKSKNKTELNNNKRATPPGNFNQSQNSNSKTPPTPNAKTPELQEKSLKRPRSSSSIASASTISPIPPNKKERLTPPTNTNSSNMNNKEAKESSQKEKESKKEQSSPVPTIRPGMEVMSGNHPHRQSYPTMFHPAMYHQGPQAGYSTFGGDFFLANPAFRDLRLPPPPPTFSPYGPYAPSPYLASLYAKQAQGPCRDPYCTGCPSSAPSTTMICPAGCAQCDHQKVPLSSYAQFPLPPTTQAQGQAQSLSPKGSPPHICSWIVGDNYCGKRFQSSEELLQHLRSHTSGESSAASAAQSASAALALQQHLAASSLYSAQAHPALLQQMQMQMQIQQMRGAVGAGFSPPISPYQKVMGSGYYNPYGMFPGRPPM